MYVVLSSEVMYYGKLRFELHCDCYMYHNYICSVRYMYGETIGGEIVGVDYYLVCLDCLERMYVGTNIEYTRLIEAIIRDKITLDDILEGCHPVVREFIRDKINSSVIKNVVKFVERHKQCEKVYLWNDMMDIEGDGYIPEVEWNRKPNRKRNIERMKQNILKWSPLVLIDDRVTRGIRFDFKVPKEIEEVANWETRVVKVIEARYIVECENGKYYECVNGDCVEYGS